MGPSSLQAAEQLCQQAQRALQQAAQNHNPLLIQQALKCYEEALALDVPLEDPLLGLAYLSLCAQDHVMAERLLVMAEKINPGAATLLQLKQYLQQSSPLSEAALTQAAPAIIASLQPLPTVAPTGMPRPLQRILGPLEGLIDTPQELQEMLSAAWGLDVSDTDSQTLWEYLHTTGDIDLAGVLRGVQQCLGNIDPRFQRKLTAFAEELSGHETFQIHCLQKCLRPFTGRFGSVETLSEFIHHHTSKAHDPDFIQALFESLQADSTASLPTLLRYNILHTTQESHRLRDLYLWAQELTHRL